MKLFLIIVAIFNFFVLYLMIGLGIFFIYSKMEYGSWKGYIKDDSDAIIGWMFGWPFALCLFIIFSPFLIVKYILDRIKKE